MDPLYADYSPQECARWVAFIRLYCYARTPACIYSKIMTNEYHKVWYDWNCINVPDYISNILADMFAEISAREAAIADEVDPVLRDLLVDFGVLPAKMPKFSLAGVGLYGLSKQTVVRLGATCVARCAEAVGCEVSTMEAALKREVERLGWSHVEPAPLWSDEIRWLGREWGAGLITG